MVPFGEGNMDCFVSKLATDFGIPSYGMLRDLPRDVYLDHAPLVWSFMPDQETQTALSAGFICRSLGVARAKFTSDPSLVGRERRFGMILPTQGSAGWTRGPEMARHAELLMAETSSRCGMTWGAGGTHLVRTFLDGGTHGGYEAARIMSDFKAARVTTVICYCVPVHLEITALKMQAAAAALNYLPEWYVDHASRMDRALWHRRGSLRVAHRAFGVTPLWYLEALEDQEWYQAYASQFPRTTPNERLGFDVYYAYLTLFRAIEAGGRDLTVSSVAAGMPAFTQRDFADVRHPAGGYETSKPNPYTFVDSGMAFWWDALGQEPGGVPMDGCVRVANGGVRAYADTWRRGDAMLFAEGPCTGSPSRVTGL